MWGSGYNFAALFPGMLGPRKLNYGEEWMTHMAVGDHWYLVQAGWENL